VEVKSEEETLISKSIFKNLKLIDYLIVIKANETLKKCTA